MSELRPRRSVLYMPSSNERALAMYRKAGFDTLGVRQGYYKAHNGNEDAVVLVRHFAAAPGSDR